MILRVKQTVLLMDFLNLYINVHLLYLKIFTLINKLNFHYFNSVLNFG